MFDTESPPDTCALYNGLIAWKNVDIGLYYYGTPKLQVENSIFVENGLGIFPYVMGPSAIGHTYDDDKTVKITNNIFIGKTSSFSETLDVAPSSSNFALSSMARAGGHGVCGKRGVWMTIFTGGGNGHPSHPLVGIMNYQNLKGLTIFSGQSVIVDTKSRFVNALRLSFD